MANGQTSSGSVASMEYEHKRKSGKLVSKGRQILNEDGTVRTIQEDAEGHVLCDSSEKVKEGSVLSKFFKKR